MTTHRFYSKIQITMGTEGEDREQPKDESISPGLRAFGEKLKTAVRIRLFMSQVENLGPASDPAVLQLIGQTWGEIREADGYSVGDGVRRLNTIAKFPIEEDDLILFEGGWTNPEDYREGLIGALGRAYGHQELAEVHERFFVSIQNRK